MHQEHLAGIVAHPAPGGGDLLHGSGSGAALLDNAGGLALGSGLGGCFLRARWFQHVGLQLAAHLFDARLLHVQFGLGARQLGCHLALGLGHHGHRLGLRVGHPPGHVRAQGAKLRVQARDLSRLMILRRLNG